MRSTLEAVGVHLLHNLCFSTCLRSLSFQFKGSRLGLTVKEKRKEKEENTVAFLSHVNVDQI